MANHEPLDEDAGPSWIHSLVLAYCRYVRWEHKSVAWALKRVIPPHNLFLTKVFARFQLLSI
jgi:hypothetical protein